MLKKGLLFLLILIPGIFVVLLVWNNVTRKTTTIIGWNGTSSALIDSLNQLGFRGKTFQPRKNKSTKIILFVGDSHVESNSLPFYYMMENLVQQKLQQKDSVHQYQCYTIGAGGFGQDQEFLALKEYFKKYEADNVIMWLTPENDIWNNIFPTHWPVNANPKPTYWIENNKLKGPNFEWLEEYPSPGKPVWKQPTSALTKLDTKWESKLPAPYKAVPKAKFKGSIVKTPAIGANEAIEIEKSHYAVFLEPQSDLMKYGIQLTRFLLDSMLQIVTSHNADFNIFAALNDEVSSMPDTSFSVEAKGLVYKLNKNAFFKNLDQITTGFNFHLFQLSTRWKQISRQDNHHFNHEAQQEIADKIVDEILLPGNKSKD